MDWIKCTEETCPDCECYLVAVYQDKWYYWTEQDCPYGWNVLCRSIAYWTEISEPIKF